MRSETISEDQYLVTHFVNTTGVRLDAFLKELYRKRSREQVKRAIDEGAVTVRRNQSPHLKVGRLKPASLLQYGDEVCILSERKPEPDVCFDYRILYQDETLLVIDKPPNLPVHPAGRYFFNTLLIHLRTNGHKLKELKAENEYFLVHRIDKETSGVLVLAKTKDVCADITRQFAERSTEKYYLAIAHGVTPETFTVDVALKRATNSLIDLKMMVAPESEGAQNALTHFKRRSVHRVNDKEYSLVECYPKTGRQHQIRIHLEHAGHAIVGDKLYGIDEAESLRFYERKNLTPEAQARLVLPRHALHATGIRFENPSTGKIVQFDSPLPPDLSRFLSI